MNKAFSIISLCFFAGLSVFAQVSINTDGNPPETSAMLDVKSTTKGALLPRMTYAQRSAIVSPSEGLMVICTNCKVDGTGCISLYMGAHWLNLTANCDLPATPGEGSHEQSTTQIIWNWSAVPIANGYKWNTVNDFGSATSMGNATTKTETGLISGNSYTRYVWAFNECGYAHPVTLCAQALTCGSSFTVNHAAGSVAPVTKSVTYGTVFNIPGETSKCWITQNLGATQQPATVNDNTEPASGWYWQFNRKQGYKHDGTILMPAWTVTTSVEDSDWQPACDPCTLLLGSAWRIPTSAEWTNIDGAGGWYNWNGPWGSGLQIHAAGYLANTNGAVYDRGIYGYYWSSTQYHDTYGLNLFMGSTSSAMTYYDMAYGFPLRCVRD